MFLFSSWKEQVYTITCVCVCVCMSITGLKEGEVQVVVALGTMCNP